MTDHEHDFGRYNQLNDFCEVAGCMVSAWEYLTTDVKRMAAVAEAVKEAWPELQAFVQAMHDALADAALREGAPE